MCHSNFARLLPSLTITVPERCPSTIGSAKFFIAAREIATCNLPFPLNVVQLFLQNSKMTRVNNLFEEIGFLIAWLAASQIFKNRGD